MPKSEKLFSTKYLLFIPVLSQYYIPVLNIYYFKNKINLYFKNFYVYFFSNVDQILLGCLVLTNAE